MSKIDELLNDNNILDIHILAWNDVWVKTKEKEKKQILNVFQNIDEYMNFITDKLEDKIKDEKAIIHIKWTEEYNNKVYIWNYASRIFTGNNDYVSVRIINHNK